MSLKIYSIPRVKTLILLYILGNLFVLGQSKEHLSNEEESDKSTVSKNKMKQFLERIVMRRTLNDTENPLSFENNEITSTEYPKENTFNTDENSLSIPSNSESHNNLYYNAIIGNEFLSNNRNDHIEDQVLHLYDTVTSHPLFYKVLSKNSFQVLVAEVTRLTLVINSTQATIAQGDSVKSQETISDLVPTVNSDLGIAISELNQQLDIVEPVIHNVTSSMQEIMSDDKIDENDVLDLIYDILPDPVKENLSEDHEVSQSDIEVTTIISDILFEENVTSSSNSSVTSTIENIRSENTLNSTTLNSSFPLESTSSFKENVTLSNEEHNTIENNFTTPIEISEDANLPSMIDLLSSFDNSTNITNLLNVNKSSELQMLDILKIKPGSLYFDPYDPMSYILALQSVYNQSNHVNSKYSGSKRPSLTKPSNINSGDKKPEITQDDSIDIIEVPNNMQASIMSPGQYIESPLIPNDEEIVTSISSSTNNVSENNDIKEISIVTENPDVNSTFLQNINEKNPTLIESAEMLIKIMADSLSLKHEISINDAVNYNENDDKVIPTSSVSPYNKKNETFNNAEYLLDMMQQSMTPKPLSEIEISVDYTDNNKGNYDKVISTTFVSSNNEKNESSNNAEYLLGMMQQSMTSSPKPITEQPESHNSLLNNFLNSWFKPILEYTNKTSQVISSLPDAAYDLLKNNTIQWPNIIATNITKGTDNQNIPSAVVNDNEHISHINEFSHSISVNNSVSNHIPSSADTINLNINIFQHGKQQKDPTYSTISSDIYDYYEYYDYEFPQRQRRNNDGDDYIKTDSNNDITTELYTEQPYDTESVDRITITDKEFMLSQDEIASGIVIKSSIEKIETLNLLDKESISITKRTLRPSQEKTTTVALKRSEPGQLLGKLSQEQIDSDNPFQFPRTSTIPPPEAIKPADLLLSKTPNLPRNNEQKPTRQQLEDALLLLLDLQDEFNNRNTIQPQVNAAPPKPPPTILNLQGPPGTGSSFQVSMSYGTGEGQTYDGTIVQPNQVNPYPRPRPSEPFTNSFQPQPASISSSDSYNPYPTGNTQGSSGGLSYPNYPPPPGYPGYPVPPPFPPPNYPPYSPYPYPHYGGCRGGSASTSTSTGPGSAAAAAAAGGGCGGGGSTSTSTSVKQSAGSGSSPGTVAVDVGNPGGGGSAPSIPQAPFRPPSPPPVIPASAPSPSQQTHTRRPSTRAPPFSISFGNGRRTTTVAPQTESNLSPQEYDRVVGALNTLLSYLRKRQTQSAAAPVTTSTTPRPRRGGIVGLLQGLRRGGSNRVPAAPNISQPRPSTPLPQQPGFGHYPYSLPGASCFVC